MQTFLYGRQSVKVLDRLKWPVVGKRYRARLYRQVVFITTAPPTGSFRSFFMYTSCYLYHYWKLTVNRLNGVLFRRKRGRIMIEKIAIHPRFASVLSPAISRLTWVFISLTRILLTGVLFSLHYKSVLTGGHLFYLKPWPTGGHLDTFKVAPWGNHLWRCVRKCYCF